MIPTLLILNYSKTFKKLSIINEGFAQLQNAALAR
jgi:hypothetical protein